MVFKGRLPTSARMYIIGTDYSLGLPLCVRNVLFLLLLHVLLTLKCPYKSTIPATTLQLFLTALKHRSNISATFGHFYLNY